MNKKTKAFVYNLISFTIIFLGARYLVATFTHLEGYFIPLTAFVAVTLLAPMFQTVKTKDGEKLFMKWLFIRGLKEIK